ncbi:hypothetical protein EB796_006363 [Bugula neritina]|uniref:Uncharacterized protein n=1 Tax=Bugula neritina TaxID=10212 RepID=A0A7J7KBW2_BUGNE|nr:hypothetical protein EB796_006363 [Bugula neritina]
MTHAYTQCACKHAASYCYTGIYPFNPDVFGEDEFLQSAVTDRPDPNIGEPLNSPGPDRSSTSQPSAHMLTPNGLSTLERCHENKTCYRKKSKSLILTNTPVKLQLEQEELAKMKKPRMKRKLTRKNDFSSESEGESANEILAKQLGDEDSSSDELIPEDNEDILAMSEKAKVGSYILVKFQSKRRTCHYVAIITETDGVISTVSFFKAIEGAKISFVKPDKEDIAEVDNEDFVRILPTPNITGGTNRLAESI